MTSNGQLVGDLTKHEDRMVVGVGGAGGYGNVHFKSAFNQRPLESTEGHHGEEKIVELELKTIADVGLVSKKKMTQ